MRNDITTIEQLTDCEDYFDRHYQVPVLAKLKLYKTVKKI